MTTQTQLLALAEKHKSERAVQVLLLSIAESRTLAKQHLQGLSAATHVLESALDVEEGFRLSLNHSDLVSVAARAASLAERMAADFMNLATLLQGLGEDIAY